MMKNLLRLRILRHDEKLGVCLGDPLGPFKLEIANRPTIVEHHEILWDTSKVMIVKTE